MKLALCHDLKERGARGLAPPSKAGGSFYKGGGKLQLCTLHIPFPEVCIHFLYSTLALVNLTLR